MLLFKIKIRTLFFNAVLYICIISCNSDIKIAITKETLNGKTMGTSYSVSYVSDSVSINKKSIDSLLFELNSSLSTYIDSSIISKANTLVDTMEIDAHMCAVVGRAIDISKLTNGAFDFSILPLVNAYGFGTEERKDHSPSELNQRRKNVNYSNIDLSCYNGNCFLIKKNKGAQLDLSAIAKGYGVDQLSAYLEEKGVSDYLVEIGGELKCKGANEIGQYWRIGITKPDTNAGLKEYIMVLSDDSLSLATSGNYRNYYWKGDELYVHTIDPKSGKPISSDLLSVTIQAPDCMTADAIATACMVMGKDSSIKFINDHEDISGVLFYKEKDSLKHINVGLKARLMPKGS
jgi:thiamine biosynthesis lipoprotein